MTILILYTVFFLIMIWLTLGKEQNVTYRVILYYFLLGSLCAWYIRFRPNLEYMDIPLSVEAILYHCLMLCMLIYPFKKFKRFENVTFNSPDTAILNCLIAFVVPISLLYIYISIAATDLRMILVDVQSMRQNLIDTAGESGTLHTYLRAFGNSFHGLALSIAFYYIIKKPSNTFLIYLLLFCSLSPVIHSLNFAAREYVAKYFFVFFMLCLLFKQRIDSGWKKKLMRFVLVGVVLGAFFFIIVTIIRFTNGARYSNPVDSIFAYLGQGYCNFSQRYLDFPDGATGGRIHFTLFSNGPALASFNLNQEIRSDYYLNTFATTVGSWVIDIGIWFTTIAVLVHFLLFKLIGRLQLNIFTLYYVIYAYEFIFSCLFFYNDTIGKQRMETILFVILLDILNRRFQSKNNAYKI